MKLVHVKNERSIMNGRPKINIGKSGYIRLSGSLVRESHLTAGDMVSFHQDEENPTDWYFKKGGELILRAPDSDSVSLTCNSSFLSKKIRGSLKISDNVSIPISTEPVEGEYYALITSAVISH